VLNGCSDRVGASVKEEEVVSDVKDIIMDFVLSEEANGNAPRSTGDKILNWQGY